METQGQQSVAVVEKPAQRDKIKIEKRSDNSELDPVRYVTKKLLEPYMKYKAALECSEDLWSPALVARYDDRETPNQDLPVLRTVAEIVESLQLEPEQQDVIVRGVYDAIRRFGRERTEFLSSTEQAAFRKMEQEREETLLEMERRVQLLEKALPYLPKDLRQVIEKTYMVPDPLSQQEIADLIGVDDERTVRRKKKQAIGRITEFLFPQSVS